MTEKGYRPLQSRSCYFLQGYCCHGEGRSQICQGSRSQQLRGERVTTNHRCLREKEKQGEGKWQPGMALVSNKVMNFTLFYRIFLRAKIHSNTLFFFFCFFKIKKDPVLGFFRETELIVNVYVCICVYLFIYLYISKYVYMYISIFIQLSRGKTQDNI